MWYKKFCTAGGGRTFNMLFLAPNLTLFATFCSYPQKVQFLNINVFIAQNLKIEFLGHRYLFPYYMCFSLSAGCRLPKHPACMHEPRVSTHVLYY